MKKLESYLVGFIIGIVAVITGALIVGALPNRVQQVGQVVLWASSMGLVIVLREKHKMPFAWILVALVTLGAGAIPFFLGSFWVKKTPSTKNNIFSWKSVPKSMFTLLAIVVLAIALWIPIFNLDYKNKIYSTTVVRAYPAVALMYADQPESINQAIQRFNNDIEKIRLVQPKESILVRVFGFNSGPEQYKQDVLRIYEDFGDSEHWSNWQDITTLTSERRTKWETWSQKNIELSKHYSITPSYTKLVAEVDQLGREIEDLDNKMNSLKTEADMLYDQFITRLEELGI